MTNKAVIGLGFGDEGKGLTTDFLCSKTKNPLVIRFSGGHQVGHTVVYNNIRHVFSNFGSGTLRGVPTYWSKFCTINPIGIINEINILWDFNKFPTLYIDERCPVTTPYDIEANKYFEMQYNNGSTGVGYGKTIEREENFYSLTFLDLFYENVFKEKLYQIKNYYKVGNLNISKFIENCEEITSFANKTFGIPKGYKNYIFEGSQGLMLDQHFGFFPNVTRSNLGLKNIKELINNKLELYLVTRAYQTRHGNGYMTNENIIHNIKVDSNESNINNKYQGKFRRSLLDVSLLKYVINKDEHIRNIKNKNLVITCLDHIENELRFTYKGNIIYCNSKKSFAVRIGALLDINNIYISESAESKNINKV